MSDDRPGKEAGSTGPFEFVSESNMDFENFKNRAEFADEHGGGGELFQRPGTPSTVMTSDRGRSESRDSERTYSTDAETGVTYPTGYHTTPSALREYSPSPSPSIDQGPGFGRTESNPYQLRDESGLLSSAAPMGQQTPEPQYTAYTPYTPGDDGRQDYFNGRR